MLTFRIHEFETLVVWGSAVRQIKIGGDFATTKNQESAASGSRCHGRSERAPIKKRRWDEDKKAAQDRETAWLHRVIVGSRDVNHEGADPKRTKQCQNMLGGIGQSARFRAGTVTANDKKSLHDYRDLNDPDDGKLKWPAESGVVSQVSGHSVDRHPDK